MKMKHKLTDISPKDKGWIEKSASLGKSLCEFYGNFQEDSISPVNLDLIFQSWREDKNTKKFEDNEIIKGLGCLFGELMCSEFNLQWKIIEDNDGIGLTLIHPKSNWKTYPLDFVAKRIDSEDNESGFFEAMHQLMKNELYKVK